jgi:spore germination protein KC
VVFLLAFLLLLSGCWSRRELDQIAIVGGLGIDKAEASGNAGGGEGSGGNGTAAGGGNYAEAGNAGGGVTQESGPIEVTAQIVLPSGIRTAGTTQSGGSGQAAFWNLKNSSTSVFSALRHNTHVSNKKLYLAHTEVAVFGRAIAEEGIADYLDYF